MAHNSSSPVALSTLSVGTGSSGSTNMVARVTLVDFEGSILLDTYVLPTMPVSDYRTSSTGIDSENLRSGAAISFSHAQRHVAEALRGRVVIGYSLWKDLSVLGIAHPAAMTRDVALFIPFRMALGSPKQIVGLATLSHHLLHKDIQLQRLDSLENARATLDLYRSHATSWEHMISDGQWPCALPPSSFSGCYL